MSLCPKYLQKVSHYDEYKENLSFYHFAGDHIDENQTNDVITHQF
jgi:hypothetical protein